MYKFIKLISYRTSLIRLYFPSLFPHNFHTPCSKWNLFFCNSIVAFFFWTSGHHCYLKIIVSMGKKKTNKQGLDCFRLTILGVVLAYQTVSWPQPAAPGPQEQIHVPDDTTVLSHPLVTVIGPGMDTWPKITNARSSLRVFFNATTRKLFQSPLPFCTQDKELNPELLAMMM